MRSLVLLIAVFGVSSAHAADTTLNDSDLREISTKLAKEISLCAQDAKSIEIKSVKNKTADFVDTKIIVYDFNDEFQKIARKTNAKARKKVAIDLELTAVTREDAQSKSSAYKMIGKFESGTCQGAAELVKNVTKSPKN